MPALTGALGAYDVPLRTRSGRVIAVALAILTPLLLAIAAFASVSGSSASTASGAPAAGDALDQWCDGDIEKHALPDTVVDPDTGEEVKISRELLLQEPFIDEYYNETYTYLIPREPGILR